MAANLAGQRGQGRCRAALTRFTGLADSTGMMFAVVGGGIALAAYAIACRLTGENLVATWWDEWQLSRRSLAELDACCSANSRRCDVVVSLTTIPSRIDALAPTLKSLLRQRVRPAEIRLCVPAFSIRENRAYLVPDWLRSLRNVTVVPCEDAGPATKFLPTLQNVAPDQPVLVLDDDRIYHARLIETLGTLAEKHPHEVVSAAGWNVPDDLVDRPTTLVARLRGAAYVPIRANQVRTPRSVAIVQGLHGYVVRPCFFDLTALANVAGVPAAVRYVDDVWLSAHCRVPQRVRPMALPFTDYQPLCGRALGRSTALGRNVNNAVRADDRANSVALRYFSERWPRAAASGAERAETSG